MPLPVEKQAKYWGISAAVGALILWFLGDVLLPFVIGAAIAYFLDPVADRIENMGFSRTAATGIITVICLLAVIILVLAIIPTLVNQAVSLFNVAPTLFADLQAFLAERFPSLINEESALRQALGNIGQLIQSKGGELVNTILNSAFSVLNWIMLLVISPVVAVYLLLDWDRMIARIDELVPMDHVSTVRRLAKEVDTVLAGFVRGMGSVCMILGTYYAIALWLVGLNFGLVVGVVAGLLTFIPYVGSLVGGVLAIGLALFQFWGEWHWIALVAAIFLSGQAVEGNFLTPRLVGKSVGLHPVWLLLALSVFGSLFGFIGMLIAVPLAASLGVLARFATEQYKGGRLYRGIVGRKDT